MAEMLVEMKYTSVEVKVKRLRREDRAMLERMIEKEQETRVSISHVTEPETIRDIHGLKENIVELDISWDKNRSDSDWKTIGEMTGLERLNIESCNMQEEQCSRHLGRLKCRIER
ncbi:hypothetical protein GNI_056170 [Gregarina niphandrodes]|uniref:Uncharacterized protein n=1 Tax=Gregarina niphandrodes TaxID=110365 RepID=A0A023B8R5_GRENI|nr:hypothetical protein GNI_056170 [Gregarina niphandrodes]EZG70294.1 hypothetical protein GNI_056170 [Gregarina niphandrodes]|eukprot:XP_011129956.1 hypothetical protein GNI_056170 [Gregarina niphandrodes]